MALIGSLAVVVDGDRVVDLSFQPPIAATIRATPAGPELWLVGTAASLLAGDRCRLDVRLLPGSRLTVRSAAAQMAHPCPVGESQWSVRADVGVGATLAWLPEPLVACAECRYVGRASVVLAEGASVLWREEIILGRVGEDPRQAAVLTALVVERHGHPLVADGLDTELPGAFGPAVLGDARYVGSAFLLGQLLHVPLPGVHRLGDVGVWTKVVERSPADGRAWLDQRVGALSARLWRACPMPADRA